MTFLMVFVNFNSVRLLGAATLQVNTSFQHNDYLREVE